MNGESVVIAVATSAAGRPTVRRPSEVDERDRRDPGDERRERAAARATCAMRGRSATTATKNSGGVISASEWTVESTPPQPVRRDDPVGRELVGEHALARATRQRAARAPTTMAPGRSTAARIGSRRRRSAPARLCSRPRRSWARTLATLGRLAQRAVACGLRARERAPREDAPMTAWPAPSPSDEAPSRVAPSPPRAPAPGPAGDRGARPPQDLPHPRAPDRLVQGAGGAPVHADRVPRAARRCATSPSTSTGASSSASSGATARARAPCSRSSRASTAPTRAGPDGRPRGAVHRARRRLQPRADRARERRSSTAC